MSSNAELELRKKRALVAGSRRADQNTPLIKNCWYVIARSSEVSRSPIARDILGTSVVMFRKENGDPVALQNRCAHRSFPLVNGKLEGDVLTCGYHGLQYDCSGQCIAIPMQERKPTGIAVKAYAVKEYGDFVWMWGGNATEADDEAFPSMPWLADKDWKVEVGHLEIDSNYVHLHENLLDLSHLSFLHESSFGTPEYARAPVEMSIEDNDIQVWREVKCVLPDIYAKPLGWQNQQALRRSGSQFLTPGLHLNTGILRNLEISEAQQQPLPMVKVLQLITPASQFKTLYWYAQCRNFEIDNDEMGAFMIKANGIAFAEDQFALEEIAKIQAFDRDADYFEADIATDKAGITMRTRLKELADAEGD
ncbi:MAG: aromatic ring-hydroxylating dioxygenase subunit alpha [Pseudomonadota bacterium]